MFSSTAWGIKEPETGRTFPNTTTCGGAQAKAAGVGVREATFGIDVYAVVLYASDKAAGQSVRSTSECIKIRARFVRDVGADKIRAAWLKGFKKNGLSASDPTVTKFLGVVGGEMKKNREMVMEMHGSKVIHKYMGKTVTVTGAAKLARALKSIYTGSGSPTPELLKDLKKRGMVRP
ncbi:MAG: chalcone isomerase family protein [Deltaproteobacteria bacterium]|nr:chalcone isomerase family protein [Deltaproteobacteria bacterium]